LSGCDVALPIECDPNERGVKQFFVRTTQTVGADDSIKWYDLGNVQVCTEGQQTDGVIIGQLWHAYAFVFKKPQQARSVVQRPIFSFGSNVIAPPLLFGSPSGDYTFVNVGMAGCTVDVPGNGIIFSRTCDGLYNVDFRYNNVGTTAFPGLGMTATPGVDLNTFSGGELLTGGTARSYEYSAMISVDGSVPISKEVYFSPNAGPGVNSNLLNASLQVYVTPFSSAILPVIS